LYIQIYQSVITPPGALGLENKNGWWSTYLGWDVGISSNSACKGQATDKSAVNKGLSKNTLVLTNWHVEMPPLPVQK